MEDWTLSTVCKHGTSVERRKVSDLPPRAGQEKIEDIGGVGRGGGGN